MRFTNGADPSPAGSSIGNGLQIRNGARAAAKLYHGHDREEVTRLILQTLQDLGYASAATAFEQESHTLVESSEVAAFKESVLQGNWDKVEQLLSLLEFQQEGDAPNALFIVREQKYLELLEQRNVPGALQVLRSELTSLTTTLNHNVPRLHFLSSLMMCLSSEDLYEQAHWDGASGTSRRMLLGRLQRYVSPSAMIPEHRLATLLDQAKAHQVSECLYHNSAQPISLFDDHECDKNEFPSTTIEVLEGHKDEVWFVKFSNNGKFLASASKDRTVIIWDVEAFEILHVLEGHDDAVSYVDWSPDDSKLLTCATDHNVRLYDVRTGGLVRVFQAHHEPVSSCAWLPSGQGFITGSMDGEIVMWNLQGGITHKWSGSRIYDLAVSMDGTRLVSICTAKKMHIYNLITKVTEASVAMPSDLTCVTISKDSRYALINVATKEVHLWDLERVRLVRKFSGQVQGKYVIRSAFGGLNEAFVISGSEDACVYVWNKEHGTLVEKLKGHVGTVNSVSWNPSNVYMFASAGDDKTVRIWSKSPELRGRM
ncbi:WD repeat-containing protein [Saitoella complicata NRRL Y-17804]|nr:WD repeat-containing protein [Saitoella complicata NRRL Y-17804]ODQ54189.1 WD repeat-containing protein [Saitoella complicata NRRL Y-17804]GAO49229.1 hypothetical protein G7K_3384-t1 [Saitoella complicata NRRL Y-17804]